MNSTIFTESEIRPEHLMAEQHRLHERDIARLLARRSEFVHRPCPACNADDPRWTWRKHDLDFVLCMRCQTVYMDPRPSPDLLRDHYSTSEDYVYWASHVFPASEDVRRAKIFKPRAELLQDICRRDYHDVIHGVDMLEVGASFGTFCEEVRKLDIFKRIIAVEPTRDLAEKCRQRGLEVLEQRIEDADLPPSSVDVIASFECIEHLFAPRDFLGTCHKLLSPHGLLVLSCPNVKGFDIAILREKSSAVDAEHLNLFHPASLKVMLEDCGFDMVDFSTPGQLDAERVRQQVLSGDVDLSGQPFLQQVLVDGWELLGEHFQGFLAARNLSSHMLAVARRK